MTFFYFCRDIKRGIKYNFFILVLYQSSTFLYCDNLTQDYNMSPVKHVILFIIYWCNKMRLEHLCDGQ